ncbi:MAG TPA: hypothetical protein VL358_09430 [Caulobacteraceae bacterium]|jgi:hypothetical protein|nr:hypothetical protein [Caulobacteraceae bacterium]
MTILKTTMIGAAFATVVAAGTLAVSTPASADVACNRWGDCWHVTTHYKNYPRAAGVVFHNDAWRRAHEKVARYQWREDHAGRGYWRNGVWITF